MTALPAFAVALPLARVPSSEAISARRQLVRSPTTSVRAARASPTSPRMASNVPKPDPSTHSTLRTSGKNEELVNVAQDTKIIHAGVHRNEWSTDPLGRSYVNPPVYHASTITFPNVATLRYAASDWPYTGVWYGRHGTPTHFALEEAFSSLEGATNSILTSSGVSACNAALLAFVKSGDHILVTDAVYDPTRSFCNKFLARFGVETTYFSPSSSADQVASLIRPNTRLIFLESPASLSFELQDVPAITERAHAVGVKVAIDNTWGPSIFKPLSFGVDISINAATKYISGHSDLMMGIAAARDEETYRAVRSVVVDMGCPPGPDDAYLALRGLRTLGVRMQRHGESAMRIARWLETRPEVKRVMHPGLESHPQHDLFKKQFSASAGLFGFQLCSGFSQRAVDAMLDGMRLHTIGLSWGGYESLLIPTSINSVRSAYKWEYGGDYGQTMRINVGLEDVDDLIRDLDDGFLRLHSINEADKAA